MDARTCLLSMVFVVACSSSSTPGSGPQDAAARDSALAQDGASPQDSAAAPDGALAQDSGSDVGSADGAVSPPSDAGGDSSLPGGLRTKWYPGHYQTIKSKAYSGGVANWTKPKFQTAIAHRNMKGYLLYINWRELETAREVYDFSQIESILGALPAGKKFQIKIQDRSFHNEAGGNMPDYVTTEGCTFPMPNQKTPDPDDVKGLALKWWVPGCLDHFIRLYVKLGERYDSDARVAAITVGDGESCLEGSPLIAGFTDEGYNNQMIRAVREVKAAFPTTLVAPGFNCFAAGEAARVAAALEQIGGTAFMHPDTVPGVYFGKNGSATLTEIEYHGRVPTIPQFQQTQIDDGPGSEEQQIWDWAIGTIKVSMASWGDGASYTTDYIGERVLPFLDTNPTFPAGNVACPSSAGTCIAP